MPSRCRNLTIMLSDIVVFTAATSRMSREDMMAMLATHDELVRPVLAYYKGRIVKTMGDAIVSVFESATDAVLCAIRTQYVLSSYNKGRATKSQIHIRVALNAGDVQIDALTADEVTAKISGSGEIDLAGNATAQDVTISGSGKYLAGDLCSDSVKVSISGSGDATVCATESLDSSISGSGSVNYYGRPSISTSGSGSGKINNLGEK